MELQGYVPVCLQSCQRAAIEGDCLQVSQDSHEYCQMLVCGYGRDSCVGVGLK